MKRNLFDGPARGRRRLTRIGALALSGAMAVALAACGGGGTDNGEGGGGDDGVFRIALSNSYIGNQWRVQMINLTQALAAQEPYASQVELTVNSSGEDPQAQIQAINNMIADGVDAILVNAASDTALNPVLEQAVERGILVVSFDHTVTAPNVYKIGVDFEDFGRVQMQWLVDQLGGSGDIIINRGPAGLGGEAVIYAGQKEVLDQNPGINVVEEVYGKWDETVSQAELTKALIAHPDVDGVANQYGAYGAVQAFLNRGIPFVPMAGDDSNGWRTAMLQYADQGLTGISVSDPPSLGPYALQVALDILTGAQEYDYDIMVDLPTVTTDELEEGVNVFPDLPPTIYPINLPALRAELTIQDALGNQ